MLNCTDIDCILHHHHEHRELQHHLQDNRQHHEHHGVMSGSTGDSNDQIIQDILNGTTDSELSSLEHVDAPNEGVYMVCGVLIAMILVALIIVLLAVTISKLRKRDENQLNHVNGPTVTNHNNNIISPPDVVVSTVTAVTSTQTAVLQPSLESTAVPPPFLWQYSASKPVNKTSSQYTLYSNDQESLVRNVSCEEPSECRKGVRKNLGGKLRRLIKKKPQQEAYTIPAELRDQLKQIYVY
ncbi:uncharacterized protein [Bemisia tabaci]|uniref:uncharacterized protein isoform X2 n=1 Tax=Bemisia tabaci TaxID=7038 RepID=UPI0008F9BB13|nr:PREDICTED: uncharacterized protein LOC109034861 [Bemisia tabaci]